jgi:hypothetical protein
MHMVSYPLFAPRGNLYIGYLFWVIYDRLTTFTQMGVYWVASAERGVASRASQNKSSPRSTRPLPVAALTPSLKFGTALGMLQPYLLSAGFQSLGRLHCSLSFHQPLLEALRFAHCSNHRCT